MLRHSYVLGALLAVTLMAANGCQSCSSCHDYDPPVANCHFGCGQCGCNSGCSSCGCNDGCSSCGCGGGAMQPTEMSDGAASEGEVVMPQGNTQSAPRSSNGSR
jgi:hypothetical protein